MAAMSDFPIDSGSPTEASIESGRRHEEEGDWGAAEQDYRRADEQGSAEGSYRLGLILYNKGLIPACHAALTRALDREHPDAAKALAAPFTDPEVSGSKEDARRGDDAGRGVSSYALGTIFEEEGDMEGAEAAYRRAIERGHVAAATNLGLLLWRQGHTDAAKSFLRSAEAGGDDMAGEKLQLMAEMGW